MNIEISVEMAQRLRDHLDDAWQYRESGQLSDDMDELDRLIKEVEAPVVSEVFSVGDTVVTITEGDDEE